MTAKPENSAVWFEIPVRDLARGKAFYGTVVQGELTDQEMGPGMTAIFPYAGGEGVSGHIYAGKPSVQGTGSTVHLAVPGPLEAAMERVKSAGGQVVSPAIEIPAGRFAYCLDPDGNSFSIFTA